MDAKVRSFNWKLLEQWWHHSLMFALLQRVALWRQGSFLVSVEWLGTLFAVLLATLPYLSNNQTGLISIAIAVFWVLLWASDRRSNQAGESTQASTWTPIHLPLLVYWLIASAATLASPVKRAAADGWVKLSIYIILFVVMNRVMRLSDKYRLNWRSLFVGIYLLTSLVVCIYGLRQQIFGAEPLATWVDATSDLAGTTRIYSFLNNPNLLAGYLMPTVPLGVAAACYWRSLGPRIVAAMVAIAGAACILFTYSRGGLIGLAVETLVLIVLLAYWWGQRLPRWSIPGVIGGAAGLVALSVFILPSVRSRFFSIFSGRGDSSNNFRLNVWMSSLQMIKARPILGIGPGNKAFNEVYPYYQRPGFSALGTYSVPLEITVEAGIIGFACYTWLVFVVVKQAWQQLNRLRNERVAEGLWIVGALAAIVGLLSHGLVDTVWYRPQVQILWWLAIALIASFYHSNYDATTLADSSENLVEADSTPVEEQ